MDLAPYIEVHSDVMAGKPCLKGTRIPVHLVLEKLAAGETTDEILVAYPQLTEDHITAALQYGASLVSEEIESRALEGLNSGAAIEVGPGYWGKKHLGLDERLKRLRAE